jgi:hypothetical protein
MWPRCASANSSSSRSRLISSCKGCVVVEIGAADLGDGDDVASVAPSCAWCAVRRDCCVWNVGWGAAACD